MIGIKYYSLKTFFIFLSLLIINTLNILYLLIL